MAFFQLCAGWWQVSYGKWIVKSSEDKNSPFFSVLDHICPSMVLSSNKTMFDTMQQDARESLTIRHHLLPANYRYNVNRQCLGTLMPFPTISTETNWSSCISLLLSGMDMILQAWAPEMAIIIESPDLWPSRSKLVCAAIIPFMFIVSSLCSKTITQAYANPYCTQDKKYSKLTKLIESIFFMKRISRNISPFFHVVILISTVEYAVPHGVKQRPLNFLWTVEFFYVFYEYLCSFLTDDFSCCSSCKLQTEISMATLAEEHKLIDEITHPINCINQAFFSFSNELKQTSLRNFREICVFIFIFRPERVLKRLPQVE